MKLLNLPEGAERCLRRLEAAGYPTYAVGGCVRDAVLGLRPQDYDLCTAALPEETEAVFGDLPLVLAGKKHGTVGVVTPEGVVEITTFRTEGGYSDSRHPDWVRFERKLEADLARRDFTVNAMAWSPLRGFADPFGGRADLRAGILRAVGEPETRFREDALRILRGVRFSVHYGLTPEPQTYAAMISLCPLLDKLARERVFEELCKLLPRMGAAELVEFAPVLAAAIPELKPTVGFDQLSPHHAYDVFTHTAHVTAALPGTLTLRWAGLLHDIGKVPARTLDENGRGHFKGHAGIGAAMAEEILLGLKAPNALRERVVLLIEQHMTPLTPDRKLLRRRLAQYGREFVEELLILQEADYRGKGVAGDPPPPFDAVRAVLAQVLAEEGCLSLKTLAISGRELLAQGWLPGRELGNCLNRLLELVMEEELPNEKEALLHRAEAWRRDG